MMRASEGNSFVKASNDKKIYSNLSIYISPKDEGMAHNKTYEQLLSFQI